MAYALRFRGDPTDEYVRNQTSAITIGSSDDFVIEFEWEQDDNNNFARPMGGISQIDSSPRVLIFSGSSTVRLTSDQRNIEWSASRNLTIRTVWRFERVSGTVDLYIDGVKQAGTKTGNTDSFAAFNVLGVNFGAETNPGLLYYAKWVVNGVTVRDYQPSLSNGTGSSLPDAEGGPSGTLFNFPTDDSQWVFYAAGGGDSATTIGLESSSEVGTPLVGQNHSLTTNGVESASEVGNPAVGQNHSLTTTGIESAPQVGTPTAEEVAGGDSAITIGLESASEAGTPSVGQNHVLSTNGLDSASEVGQPSVGQVHILSSTGIESASTASNPTALSVTGLLLGIKPSLSISVTEYSVTLAAPVYSFTVSQPKYTIQVTQPNYTVIQ